MTGTATAAIVAPRNERTAIKTVTTGASHYAVVDLTMSSAYATGGDTVDFSTLGALSGRQPTAVVPCGGASGYVFNYDLTNKKMLAYRQSAATSALTEANGIDLHTVVVRCVVFF
jgi:hypothetical protein